MKSRILGLIGLICLIGVVSCDKIEPGNYTTGTTDGGSNWENANVHRVYVEKYTGPKCPNCPAADMTLDEAHHKYGDRLVIISINHPKGQGEPFPGDPDMRTDEGNIWDNYFGINAIPAAYINRSTTTQYSGAMSNIIADIKDVISQAPQAGVEVGAILGDDDTLRITVDVELFRQMDDGITLTLALTEDSLKYRQINGSVIDSNYIHNHMLRAVITDVWGNDIPLEGNAGEHKIGQFKYKLTNPDINIENCHVVALVSRKSDRYVLNCAETTIQLVY